MRYALIVTLVVVAGCSSSPTSPSPVVPVTPPVVVVPPVVTPPPVTPPPVVPAFPPTDARFDLTFYRMFVHDAYESPTQLQPVRRQSEAPRIYLRTIDDNGGVIDAITLNGTQAALESVAGKLTGKFGLAGLERGTDTRQGQRGWITVRWSNAPDAACARAAVGGDLITMYLRTAGCRCSGPAIAPLIVKHELGHALGFWHTDQRTDLMHPGSTYGLPACDMDPSAREQYHAALAYDRPIGSVAP